MTEGSFFIDIKKSIMVMTDLCDVPLVHLTG